MSDIAVRCKSCEKVTHSLIKTLNVWSCPECGAMGKDRVYDGRKVLPEHDCYTTWKSVCGHILRTGAYEPCDGYCSTCHRYVGFEKFRDIEKIIPEEKKESDDAGLAARLKAVNVLLDSSRQNL